MSAQSDVKRFIKKGIQTILGNGTAEIQKHNKENELLTENLAFRIALETKLNIDSVGKSPYEIFYGITDQFWFWLNTEGIRKNSLLRNLLPGLADEITQKKFTGDTGDRTLWEGFYFYKLFKNNFEKYKGPISDARILDFGCGWGRIIRFFIKDLPSSGLWGCDPVAEMITLCKAQNKWANFELINPDPPTPFQDNTFDMIYSFSVFSHLSEDFHLGILQEIKRILKPGGIYLTTTRNRNFITECKAFSDPVKSMSIYDSGSFCHHNYNDETWPFWGESAISKQYVMENWTRNFTFLDYIVDNNFQNLIIIQKPF